MKGRYYNGKPLKYLPCIYLYIDLRDQIGNLVKTNLRQPKDYNVLLNVSKNLTKIVPKQMLEHLYIIKYKKYNEKVRNPMMQLLWDDRILTSSPLVHN